MEPSTNRNRWIIGIIVVLAVICLCLLLLAVVAAILFFVPVQRSLSQPASIGAFVSQAALPQAALLLSGHYSRVF